LSARCNRSRQRCRCSRRWRSLDPGSLDTHSFPHDTAAPVLATPAPVHGRLLVLTARRGRGAPSFFPLLPSRQWNRGIGKTPRQMVGGQQEGSGLGCRRLVKAVQGKRCRYAWGLGARAEGRRSRTSMAGGAPVGLALEGKGVFSPWGLPQEGTGVQRLGV
jgi:hypothetical protein